MMLAGKIKHLPPIYFVDKETKEVHISKAGQINPHKAWNNETEWGQINTF